MGFLEVGVFLFVIIIGAFFRPSETVDPADMEDFEGDADFFFDDA